MTGDDPADGCERPRGSATRRTDGGAAESVEVVLIAAVAANRVIGADGGMPWHLPADMRHFKETTTGHPVILGRRTYESVVAGLGEPFPGRRSVVLTETLSDLPAGAVAVGSVDEALETARRAAVEMGVESLFVAGGETVYEAFLPLADRMVLTELPDAYEGDSRFPAFDAGSWREVGRDEREAFDVVEYVRVD
jgi:dihydrofolate reductase